MSGVHYVQAQVRPAARDGSDPGQVVEGYYVVTDGVLTMTDRHGDAVEVDGRRYTATIDADPRAIAMRLARQIRSALNPGADFNRPLHMSPLGIV